MKNNRSGLRSFFSLLGALLGANLGYWLFGAGIYTHYSGAVICGGLVGAIVGFAAGTAVERRGVNSSLAKFSRAAVAVSLLCFAIVFVMLGLRWHEPFLTYSGLLAAIGAVFPSPTDSSGRSVLAVAASPFTLLAIAALAALSIAATVQTGDCSWLVLTGLSAVAGASVYVLRRRRRAGAS